MSFTVSIATQISNPLFLAQACDRMRAASIHIVGPTEIPGSGYRGGMHKVEMPGFYYPLHFDCKEKKLVYDGDDKFVGEKGKLFDRLQVEYRAAAIGHTVQELGMAVHYDSVDSLTGELTMRVESTEEQLLCL